MTMAIAERPPGDTPRLDEIRHKLDQLTASVASLGEKVEYLQEKAYDDRRRQR